MDKNVIVQSLKEASACIREFESESKTLKAKVAKVTKSNEELTKEAEALKMAMELVLDSSTIAEINEKLAMLKTKDLRVVREAMDLDFSKTAASIGELYDESGDSKIEMSNPTHAFYSILKGN